MTDIVERLRAYSQWSDRRQVYDPVPIAQEAADEIERLRKELDFIHTELRRIIEENVP